MKKILAALAVSAIPFSAAHAAIDGTTASATGSAGTVVITPIQVSHDTGATLSFGTIMGTTINSTMRVGTDGTNTGSVGAIAWVTGSKTSADAFTITGEPNKAVTISVPNSITMTDLALTSVKGAPALALILTRAGIRCRGPL